MLQYWNKEILEKVLNSSRQALKKILRIPANFREFYDLASFLKNSQEFLRILEIYPIPENSWESFRTG